MNDKRNREQVVTVTIDGVQQEATITFRHMYQERWGKKPRVFVDIADETLAENLENRRNRPVKIYSKIVKQALAQADVDVKNVLWSQYAGCTCACSPGFILTTNGPKNYAGKDEYAMTNIWVTIKKQAKVQNDGYITPLENYGLVRGELGYSVNADEIVESDTSVMC